MHLFFSLLFLVDMDFRKINLIKISGFHIKGEASPLENEHGFLNCEELGIENFIVIDGCLRVQ
jgi:hypothetical protein